MWEGLIVLAVLAWAVVFVARHVRRMLAPSGAACGTACGSACTAARAGLARTIESRSVNHASQ